MIIGRELIRFATDVLCCKTNLQDLFRVSFIANCRSDNFWFKNKSSIVGFCGRIVVWWRRRQMLYEGKKERISISQLQFSRGAKISFETTTHVVVVRTETKILLKRIL